jgi:hypothetical protein
LPGFLQDRSEVWTATVAARTRVEGFDLAVFAGILDMLLLSVAFECVTISASRRRRLQLRPQFRDQSQNLL